MQIKLHFLLGVLFLYIFVQAMLGAVSYVPTEADSLYYHIPLAESILEGGIIKAEYGSNMHMYFPASAEVILAVLIALKIPVGFYNVLAVGCLVGASYLLGKKYQLTTKNAVVLAAAVGTLHGVIRWVHAQTVDIWVAVFYLLSWLLLLQPKKNWLYFINLGLALGLLLGSKYSGPLFALGLLLILGKDLISKVTQLQKWEAACKVLVALVAASLTGGFWYLRNWLVMNNPVYPLDTPLFAGVSGNQIIETPIWKAFLNFPYQIFSGAVSEFYAWTFVLVTFICMAVMKYFQIKQSDQFITDPIKKLLWLSIFNLLVFLVLPSGDSIQLHISQFRFAYVGIIPIILVYLLVIQQQQHYLSKLSALIFIPHLLVVYYFPYRPKVLLLVLLLVASIYYIRNQKLSLWKIFANNTRKIH